MYISKVNFHYVFVDLSHFEVPLKKIEGFYLNFVKEVNCILKILFFFCQCLGRQLPRPQIPRSQHLGGHCRMLTSVQRTDICLNRSWYYCCSLFLLPLLHQLFMQNHRKRLYYLFHSPQVLFMVIVMCNYNILYGNVVSLTFRCEFVRVPGSILFSIYSKMISAINLSNAVYNRL